MLAVYDQLMNIQNLFQRRLEPSYRKAAAVKKINSIVINPRYP